EMATPMTLIYKMLFPAISTFDTPPTSHTASLGETWVNGTKIGPGGARGHRHQAEAGRACLGAWPRSCALVATGAMIPEGIGKGWIALDGLPTAGTFVPLECIAELHHVFSSLRLSCAPHGGRGAPLPSGAVTA